MELNPDLPNLSHIGNKYRKKTNDSKIKTLKEKYAAKHPEKKVKDRYDHYADELDYRQVFRSILNRYPNGAPLNDIRKEVHEAIWTLDITARKHLFPKVLQFFCQRRIVRKYRYNDKWYLQNT